MATNLLTYGGIITKVRSLESDLMNEENYTHISYIETTQDFISYLKSQPGYSYIFDSYDESTLHRSQIEQIMTNAVHLAYAKIYRFANQEQRNVLSLLFFRYEINILKLCLQNIFNDEDSYDLLLFENFFESHSELKIASLAASKTIEEFINHLKDTAYYPIFQKLYATHHDSLHDYEVQLDVYYFTKAWKLIDHLPNGKNKTVVKQLYGTQIDILNILWIYRSKKFYDIDSAKILASLLPITYKLKKIDISKMIEAVSIEDLQKILRSTYYRTIVDDLDAPTIEIIYDRLLLKLYKNLSRKYSHSMAPVLRYLYLKENELDKLTTALECIRYRLDPNEIQNYLLY